MSRRQQRAKALWPFDERNAFGEGVLDPELIRVLRLFEPIQVEMPYRRSGKRLVNLDQSKGRAGHFASSDPGADKGEGEGGLAAAQRPTQPDHIALARMAGEIGGERAGCRLVGQLDCNGCGVGHALLLGRQPKASQPCTSPPVPPSY